MADGKRALRIRPDWATVTTLVAALLVAAVVLFSTLNGSGGYGFEDLATVGTALVLLVLAFVPVVVRLFSGQNDWPARLLPLVIWIAALYIVIEPPPPYVNFVLLRDPLSLGVMGVGFVYFVFLPSIVTTLAVALFGMRPSLWGGLVVAALGFPPMLSSHLADVLAGMVLVGVGTFFAQACATGPPREIFG